MKEHMIKVVSTVPHQSVVKQVVCKKCGSTLEYTPNDVVEQHWADYGGDMNVTRFIQCPTCQNEVIISTLL